MILRSMRSGFMSAFFLALLVMGGVSLVFSDWNGMFRNGVGSTDVAKVDGEPIKISEFNSRLSQILRSQQIDPSAAYQMGLIDNILNNQIYDVLVKKDAAKLGIRIEDRIIADQIKGMIAPLKKEGMSDADALKKFLEMQGMNEKQLATELRNQMTSKILQATISTSSYAPESLLSDLEAYRGMTRNVDVQFLPNAAIPVTEKPSDADLQKFYEGLSSLYMIPETRDVTVAVLDTSKIQKPVIADADVKAAYDDNLDNFKVSESVDVEQSLLSDKAQAEKLVAAIRGGQTMEKAVKTLTGNTKAYQGKNNFAKDGLPAEISDVVFAAKSGDVVGPIKTALGFHVIKLVSLKEAHTQSFESVKDKIRKEIETEKAGNAVFDVTSAIEDRLANGEVYDDLKKEFPITTMSLKGLTKENALIKKSKDDPWTDKDLPVILNKSFAVAQGTASELSDIEGGKMFSVRVDKIAPAAPKPLASVKDDVMKKWISENQEQQNLVNTQKLVESLNAGTIKFDSKQFQNYPALGRKGADSLAKDVTDRLMTAETGKFILAISKEKNGVYVGRVNSVTLPKASATHQDDARSQLENDLASATYMTYMDSLQKKYDVKINNGLLKRVYGQPKSDSQ